MKRLIVVLLLSALPSITFAKLELTKELLEGLNKLYCSAYFEDKAEEPIHKKFEQEYAKAEAVAKQTGRAFDLPDYRLDNADLIQSLAYSAISERLGQQAVNDLREYISQLPMEDLLSENELLVGQSREFLAGYHVALAQLEAKRYYEGWQEIPEVFAEDVERRNCKGYLSFSQIKTKHD